MKLWRTLLTKCIKDTYIKILKYIEKMNFNEMYEKKLKLLKHSIQRLNSLILSLILAANSKFISSAAIFISRFILVTHFFLSIGVIELISISFIIRSILVSASTSSSTSLSLIFFWIEVGVILFFLLNSTW